jgi:hypothetical protein
MKLELLTNATVVDDAIRFVSSNKSKEELKPPDNDIKYDIKESNEPDYDKDEDHVEDVGEMASSSTTNQIF